MESSSYLSRRPFLTSDSMGRARPNRHYLLNQSGKFQAICLLGFLGLGLAGLLVKGYLIVQELKP